MLKLSEVVHCKGVVDSHSKPAKNSRLPDEKNILICQNCPYDDCVGNRCQLIKRGKNK